MSRQVFFRVDQERGNLTGQVSGGGSPNAHPILRLRLTVRPGKVIVFYMKLRHLLWVCSLALLLVACSEQLNLPLLERSTPTPTVTPSPTLTPTPTVTPTPSPTPTPVPAARIELGDQALSFGDWEQARLEYNTALSASQEPAVQAAALLGLGRTDLLDNEPETAIQTLSTLIQNYPTDPAVPAAYFALAEAFTALEKFTEAALAYSEYLNRRPGQIDGYLLELRGDARFAAGDYLNAAQDYLAALESPGLLDSTLLEMKAARSYALGGDTATALARYTDLYNRTSNEYTRALIDLRQGQIFTALGQLDQAYAAYVDAVTRYPTSYDSYSALVVLVDAGIPVDELSRGLVDYFAGQYGAAAAAFDRYLQDNPADPGAARYYSGLAKRRLGNLDTALIDWEKIILNFTDHTYWDEAWEQTADTLWRDLDQHPEAIKTLLEFVDLAPDHPRAAEFLFDAAQIAELDSDLGQAAELFERVANLYPGDERAGRALFLSGLARYRMEDYAGAYLAFERLSGAVPEPGERAKAHFWIGKTHEKMGNPAAARTAWETAADLDPTGYYSERAVDLLQDRQPFAPPLAYDLGVDLSREQAKAESWLSTTFNLPSDTQFNSLAELANDSRLQRGAELWQLGLFSEARAEFEALRVDIKDDPLRTYWLARYLSELGLYRTAALASRQVLNLDGMDDAQTLNAPAYFNYLRFPTHYRSLVLPAAEEYGFHPLFLFSVIRQESLFESFVQSSAAASGLMQIMPATGAEIAQNLGWPEDFIQADLNRPLINIRLGVDYLDTQRNLFGGNLYAALAAYNGGPGNASAWLNLAGDDPDLFLEVIRFEETREYVRSIYEIYNLYRRIYNRSP